MKKLVFALVVITSLQSCDNSTKDVAKISGEIVGSTDSILTVSNRTYTKTIKINSDGTFNDTLKLAEAGYYSLVTNSDKKGFLFLRNGFDLKITTNNQSFLPSLKFKGKGASSNNYLIAQNTYGRSLGDLRDFFKLDKAAFTNKVLSIKNGFDSIKSLYKNLDTTLLRTFGDQNKKFFDFLEQNYEAQHAKAIQDDVIRTKLAPGNVSPTFKNYMNVKGGKTSLSSLKGKYVYIDVWATWCRPCIGEIPSLKALEKEYHNKNIQFVSISIDDERTAGSWEKAEIKWRNMVASKNLTGVQLYAGQDLAFMEAYQISSIPRFILIDPKGNIVDSNAPRPSDPRLKDVFKQLGI